jgi:hypothetical protein
LTHASTDDLLDECRVDADSVHETFLDGTQKICRVHGCKTTTTAADGGAEGVDDDN